MKKKLFLIFFLIFFTNFVATQEEALPVYCTSSLAKYSQSEIVFSLGLNPETQISNERGCVCYGMETQYSGWRSQYCTQGKLLMQRDLFTPNNPQCSSYEKTVETQLFEDERCVVCPDPVVKSDWGLVGCYSKGRIESRSITAYLFGVQGQCQAKQMVELRNVQGQCSFNDVINSIDFWLYGAGLMILIVGGIVVYWKWFK